MNISSAVFDRSAPDLSSCPDESLPEFAFIGRSNVGKSSLLNMLCGKRDLARVSPRPGFTRMINFFTMNKKWRLVDLPGYGFAEVAHEDRTRFNVAVLEYLKHRKNLWCVFALIDSTITPQAIDLEFVQWLTSNSLPFAFVFTKIDAVKPEQAQANIAAFTERVSGWYEKMPEILSCSATTGKGRAELLQMVEKFLAEVAAQQAAPEPPKEPVILEEDVPPSGWPVFATSGKAPKRGSRKRPW
jgi:GTP-binding protein